MLISIATHKLSRLLAKDSVTSPLRAPFTRYAEPGGAAEVNEEVRDQGSSIRHSIGELVTCPFCLAVWVATGLTGGLVLAPAADPAGGDRDDRHRGVRLPADGVLDRQGGRRRRPRTSLRPINGRSPAQA